MSERLSGEELHRLVERVFRPGREDRALAVLVDLPDAHAPDHPAWRARREMAAAWVDALAPALGAQGRVARLVLYRNVRAANADLPERCWLHTGGPLPADADGLDPTAQVPFVDALSAHRLILAPTEFSTTAPLKLLAPELGFRAATMPGFGPALIPALRLDYGEIARRVERLRILLDPAEGCQIEFRAEGRDHHLHLDLRHRKAHASSGLFPEPGVAGNLPSGEAYIVPYEGERPGDPSRSAGELPVQLGDEVVVYRIERNRAREVRGTGPRAAAEAALLEREPGYSNLAELGLGVLADFGLAPCGEVLLDEKLGLHIAFGRSDHFGGQVGAKDFSSPEAVVHIAAADLILPGGRREALLREDQWIIDWKA
jgi:hypothetical protein